MARLGHIRGFKGRAASALVVACGLLLLGMPSASARWTIHNGNDVTQITAPPGGTEEQTCADRLQGQSGWSTVVEPGEDPTSITVPTNALLGEPYDIWIRPANTPTGGTFLEPETFDGPADYREPDGTIVTAVLLQNFTTEPRVLVAPEPLFPPADPTIANVYLFTEVDFSVQLLGGLVPGDVLGVKPTGEGSSFITLTAVDCSSTSARIDVRPGVSPNNVNPRQTTPLLPVLVYGSATLDVRSIAGVHLQKAGPKSVGARLRRPFDADHDGFLDRMYYFSPRATHIRCGQSSVTLTGRTHTRLRFKGSDAIQTVCR